MPRVIDQFGEFRFTPGISYPEAYKVPKGATADDIDRIKPTIIKAASIRLSEREEKLDTEKFDYLCPGCGEKMHHVKGALRKKQGAESTNQPNYGPSFFKHNPYTLQRHQAKAAPVIVADLAVVIDNIANAHGWEYENLETYSSTARRIALTNTNANGRRLRVEFVIAPNGTSRIADDFSGVLITTTQKYAEAYRSLLLCDTQGNALTAERLHASLAGQETTVHPARSLMVYGMLVPDNLPLPNFVPTNEQSIARSKRRYKNKAVNLVNMMSGIMEGRFKSVDHVDIVPDYFVPTHSRYAIVERGKEQPLRALVHDYAYILSREHASHRLAEILDGLSRGTNRHRMSGDSSGYRYGKADFVTFTTHTQGREDQLVQPGAKKIIINPEPWNLPKRFVRADWDNTLIVFYKAPDLYNKWRKHPYSKYVRDIDTSSVIATTKENNLVNVGTKFMGTGPLFEPEVGLDSLASEVERRGHHADHLAEPQMRASEDPGRPFDEGETRQTSSDSRSDPDWDIDRNFLDWETGVKLGPQRSPRRVEPPSLGIE